MWIKVILFASLFVLGSAFTLEDGVEVPRSLELLLDELKDRETRDQLTEECEGKPAEIAFIIDASRSIYSPDFTKGIDFLKHFVNIFQIGPNQVRIAAIAFGDVLNYKAAFGFGDFKTKQDVLAALERIEDAGARGWTTDTAKAIKYARTNFFSKARANVKKVAIVLTDGQSDNFPKTQAEAYLLKGGGVKSIAIGVGNKTKENELKAIASGSESVFKVNTYGALKSIINTLGFITCREITTAAPTTTTTTPPPKEEPCDGKAIDFNFVFDPAQMGMSGTEDAIRFIKTVVSSDDLNNGKVRVGTIAGPYPDMKGFRLNRYKSLTDISQHFDSYQRTNMAALITELHVEAFNKKNGGRPTASKVAVVFLKGKLNKPDLTISEAKLAKSKGIEIFVVNAGSLNHESVLHAIASGENDHILRAKSSGEIIEMARSLVNKICKFTHVSVAESCLRSSNLIRPYRNEKDKMPTDC